MGWASAGETIFQPVAREVVACGIDDEDVTLILATLILALQQAGWVTEDESLEEFSYHPAAVAAFAERGVYLPGKRCPHCDGVLEDDDNDA